GAPSGSSSDSCRAPRTSPSSAVTSTCCCWCTRRTTGPCASWCSPGSRRSPRCSAPAPCWCSRRRTWNPKAEPRPGGDKRARTPGWRGRPLGSGRLAQPVEGEPDHRVGDLPLARTAAVGPVPLDDRVDHAEDQPGHEPAVYVLAHVPLGRGGPEQGGHPVVELAPPLQRPPFGAGVAAHS